MPNSMPATIIAIDRTTEPCASAVDVTRPSRTSAKFSGGPNCSAIRVSGTATTAMARVAKVPATKEPIAAMASALPALPCRAIW